MNAPLHTPLPGDANRFDTASAAQMERLVMDLRQMYHERNAALEEVAAAHHEALLRLAMAADYRDTDLLAIQRALVRLAAARGDCQ